MRVPFTKMHGLGNDFIVLDARGTPLPGPLENATVKALADRREGIGCDQLIVMEPDDTATIRMRIYNSDGGEVEACGNASRAVGMLLGDEATIATAGGMITTRPEANGISVDMGTPRFEWDAIPLAYPMDTERLPLGWDALEGPLAVNVGNPHVVFFVDDAQAVPLDELGPQIETDSVFPERINVNVAEVIDGTTMRLRVWERGAGLTRACGTGACASAVAAMRRGLVDRKVTVHLPGGPLTIAWGEDDRITMTGGATEAFRGTFAWDDYAG
ncbi:diaminopimelate epimerase [Aurantiacibacter sp. MUD61]|uniref:diaminopimelate epimerase n=1 Tax=Aurantiacibacter sp. MUD61 TaxID=3009083 RepID=UPI0022F0A874|nr:diaminopimelate epimerase [Aurantiacibacter sp. MUD61]